MSSSLDVVDDTTQMFFDEEFNPSNYLDALFKDYDYTKTSLNKLINISNKLIIHLNFLVNQLNSEINDRLSEIKKLTTETNLNNSTRLNYYLKLLQNSIISLNNELDIPEFSQLVTINKLIKFKAVKSNMLSTLRILQFIKKNFKDLKLNNFETNLLNLFQSIMSLSDVRDKVDNLEYLIDCGDAFKNINHFNTIYKRNLGRFELERDELEGKETSKD